MRAFDLFQVVLKKAIEDKASDIHASPGHPYRLRIQGNMVPLKGEHVLHPEDTQGIAAEILVACKKATRQNVKSIIDGLLDFDCSYALADISRYRVNICSQRGSLALVLRA